VTGSKVSNGTYLGSRILTVVLFLAWISVIVPVAAHGFEYYRLPLQERPFSELHDEHRPSGLVGHGLGIVGSSLLLLGVVSYSIRKRFRIIAEAGRLSTWLQVHIFLCTLGPALVLFHTTFRFGGIVSIAFWSMSIVVVSGVFGRYVYGRIPKSIHGQFRSLDSLEKQEADLVNAIAVEFGLDRESVATLFPTKKRQRAKGVFHALVLGIWYDLRRAAKRRKTNHILTKNLARQTANAGGGYDIGKLNRSRATILRHVERRMQLEHQIMLMEPFQKLFAYWHLLHLPLTTVMFVILVLHVGVSVVFGYTWVF